MRRKKIIRKKKAKGFFYFRKHLFITALLIIAVLALLLLPNKAKTDTACANSDSCIKDLSGLYDDSNTGTFEGKTVRGPAVADKPFKVSLPLPPSSLLAN